jgi:hypothetical protein
VDAFSSPRSLFDGAAEVGDTLVVLPVVYHLLWCQRLIVELDGVALGPSTLVWAARVGQ